MEHLKLYDLELTPLPLEEVETRRDTRLAEQFAQADEIVVAAPYWDLSFPSILKVYLERVCVTGITFHYVENREEGLCRRTGRCISARPAAMWENATWARST